MTFTVDKWVWRGIILALIGIGAWRVEYYISIYDKNHADFEQWKMDVSDTLTAHKWHFRKTDIQILFLQQNKQDRKTH